MGGTSDTRSLLMRTSTENFLALAPSSVTSVPVGGVVGTENRSLDKPPACNDGRISPSSLPSPRIVTVSSTGSPTYTTVRSASTLMLYDVPTALLKLSGRP